MYKLMLVDDEDIVRHQVINKIDWEQYGFEIVCEAENGNEALELFEAHKPDVVITDIKMPFMNGLELAEKILEKYPFTKIIILTGFDEFEYAKKGIDLHITNYVLKPVSSKELIKILTDVKDMIDEEIENKRNIERLKRHYESSYELMRNKFLEGLVVDDEPDKDLQEWLDYYEIDLSGNRFIVSVVQIDDTEDDTSDLGNSELKKIALLDVIREADETFGLGPYFLTKNEVVIITGTEEMDRKVIIADYTDKLEKVRQATEKFLPYTVTIGCGHVCNNLANLHKSMRSARNACDYKLSIGSNQVIFIGDLERDSEVSFELGESDQRQVRRMLKTGALEEFTAFVEKTFNQLSQVDGDSYQMYLIELFTLLSKTTKELDIDANELLFSDPELMKLFEVGEGLSYKKSKILHLGKAIMEKATKTRKSTNSGLVDRAVGYVEENYKDWELNIEKISAHLHYSPNYFSSMFKKETGTAFMNYLANYRIDKAKELLVSSDLKNFEIAMEVGFSSANYFSFCFKKVVDLSPTAYRKSLIND